MFSPSLKKKVLWPLLTSAQLDMYHYKPLFLQESLLSPATVGQISPGKNANFLSIYLSDIQQHISDSFGLRFVWQTHPHVIASSASCSSGQRFTAGFL
jgi:hypothetical protein